MMRKLFLFPLTLAALFITVNVFAQDNTLKVKPRKQIKTAAPEQTAQALGKTPKIKIPLKFIDKSITPNKLYRVNHLRVLPLPDNLPVTHPLLDLYQLDRRFSDLFSSSGESLICAPTSLANVLIYLKCNHQPRYEKILQNHANELRTNEDWIRYLYTTCQTDSEVGTYIEDVEKAAKDAVADGGYDTGNVFILGSTASDARVRKAVTPTDLKAYTKVSPDRGIVMRFGWYKEETENGKQIYKRKGGHCVALSGYDAIKNDVFYVTNPLVDYSDLAPGKKYSKVTLQKLSGNVEAPVNTEWYTADLVGGHFAILEDIVIILPR